MSILFGLDTTLSASLGLPILPLDALDGPGVSIIHDYRRTRCLAPGPLVEGQAVHNLSRSGVPNGNINGAANITRDGQGLRFKRTNGGILTNYIRANGDGGIGIDATQSFAAVAWVQQRDPANFQGVIGTAGNGEGADANNQFGLLINGSDPTYGITGWAWDTAGTRRQFGVPQPLAPNSGIHQIGIAVVHTPGADTHMLIAYDGTIVLDASLDGVRALQAGGFPLQVGTVGVSNQGGMTIYRTALTFLGAGQDTRTAAQVFAKDFKPSQTTTQF